jgi:undecaprenyl-diphosphatase
MADGSGGALGAILLGILQGITEFLPVSSSGHLVLFQEFLPVAGDEILFDLVLHVGTLLPALWFYREDVLQVLRDAVGAEASFWERPGVRLAMLVVVATIPTGVIGIGFKDWFEAMFDQPGRVGFAFLATALLLLSTRGRQDGEYTLRNTPLWMAALLGIAQGMAITPGISRSGTTIAVALLLGLRREFAVKLSFLMSVPAILGAVLLKTLELEAFDAAPMELGLGFVAAMVSGYAALVLLVRLVKQGRFSDFAWYLAPLSLVAFWLGYGSP